MFKSFVNEKSFSAEITLNGTPNLKVTEDKPENFQTKKVDINVLIARAQVIKDKQYKKNIYIFIFFLSILVLVGVYLSL